MKTWTRGLMLACIVALVFGVTQVQAQVDYFGSIAFSKTTGMWGWAINFRSQNDAEQEAIYKCGQADCVAYLWFKNSCGALARADNGNLGWAWGYDQPDADAKALEQCELLGLPCKVIAQACTVLPAR